MDKLYSYCDFDGSRLELVDIYTAKGSKSTTESVQIVELRYKNKITREKLRFNIYPGVDPDKLPYFIFNGKVVYLSDMTDVYG